MPPRSHHHQPRTPAQAARRVRIAADAVDEALELLRAGADDAEVDYVLRHAVHEGASPAQIVREAVDRTGGAL